MDVAEINSLNLIVPNKDVTLEYGEKVDLFCKPLKKANITFFNYLKVYNDCTIADLNNAPEMTEYFYYKSNLYQYFSPLDTTKHFEQGFILDRSITEQEFLEINRNKFNIDHVIFFIEKQPNATLFWQFGTQAGNDDILNFYLNNTLFLKKFIACFKQENTELLNLSEKHKYKVLLENEQISEPIMHTSINSSTLISTIQAEFTQREKECLNLCIKGLSAKEIGKLLNISNRTVEVHIANIKKKTNCFKLSKLISRMTNSNYPNLENENSVFNCSTYNIACNY